MLIFELNFCYKISQFKAISISVPIISLLDCLIVKLWASLNRDNQRCY